MTCDERLIADLQAFNLRTKMDAAERILHWAGRGERRRDYQRKLAHLDYSVKSFESAIFVKTAADASQFRAYASTYSRDLQDDVVVPGAFANSIRRNAGSTPLLWMHDPTRPIGRAKDLKEDTHGLVFRGELRMEVQQAREAAALLQYRDIDAFSIGFRIIGKDGARMRSDGIRELRELDLVEISLVSFAANPQARLA